MTKSPHFWWIICLLTTIIIGLVSFIITNRITDSVELMEYISVFSVILSIILSIFAIQYTYHSNNEVHQQFEKINSAAENITGTSANLITSNANLNQNIEHVLNRIESIDTNQERMRVQLENIKNANVINTDLQNFDA